MAWQYANESLADKNQNKFIPWYMMLYIAASKRGNRIGVEEGDGGGMPPKWNKKPQQERQRIILFMSTDHR